jgi:hypothetical protein
MWLQGLICGALLAFATPTAVLAGALLAPSAIAWATDTAPGRPMARAVLFAATPFAVGPLWHLWVNGHSMRTALDLLADTPALFEAWLSAAFGWAVCQILPVVLRAAADMQAARQAAQLKAELTRLREEWDFRR